MPLERGVHLLTRMRGAEKLIILVAVAIPLIVAWFGWRTIGGWAAGSTLPVAGPQPPGAAATAAATARAPQPTSKPTIGAPPTIRVKAPTPGPAPTTSEPSATLAPESPEVPPLGVDLAATLAPEPPTASSGTEPSGADPGAAVSSFYTLVAKHEFDSAAQLWSPRMRAAFPPQVNLNQRFSQTQDIRVQWASVVSQSHSQATVQVDLLESDAAARQHHYVGNWYLVRGPNGWLLDQPQLQPAP